MLTPIDFSRFETALSTPRGLLDLLLVLLCLGVAWAFDRRVEARSRAAIEQNKRHLYAGAGRILFSLVALLLLVLARPGLKSVGGNPLFIDIAIPLLIALAMIRMLVYGMRKLFSTHDWLKTSERAVAFAIWVLVVLYFVGVLPEIGRELDNIAIPLGKSSISLLTIGKGIAAVVLTLIVTLWLSGMLEQRVLAATSLDSNTKAVLSRFLRALLLLVGILVALEAIGFDLTLLTVFSGALGVGIGLGLQKFAANYLAGFTILLDKSVRLGDMVTVDGRQGRVARVTSRYVLLRSLDGIEAIIPNETLITTTVINHSHASHDIRIALPVQVAYEADLPLALRLMEDAARPETRLVTESEPPTAFVLGFGDNGINLELVLWITGPQVGVASVRSEINQRVFAAFKESGIAIPSPRRDVRVVGGELPTPPA